MSDGKWRSILDQTTAQIDKRALCNAQEEAVTVQEGIKNIHTVAPAVEEEGESLSSIGGAAEMDKSHSLCS